MSLFWSEAPKKVGVDPWPYPQTWEGLPGANTLAYYKH
jgi:hypothetical protein